MKNKPYSLTAFDVGYASYVEQKELLKVMRYMLHADGTYDDFAIRCTDILESNPRKDNYFLTRFEIDAQTGRMHVRQAITIPKYYSNIIGDFYKLDEALLVIEAVTHNDISVINVAHAYAGFNWGDVYRRHDADEKKQRN